MMRAMADIAPLSPRVIVYVYGSPLLGGTPDVELGEDVARICAQEGVLLVDRVIDRGPPKSHPEQYPALVRLARGEADLLLVVRSPLYHANRGAGRDCLEAACEPGPFAWLSLGELRQAGLLPQLPKLAQPHRRRSRSPVVQRARALRSQGLGLRGIGQALRTEGYVAPGGASWSAGSVARLLGLEVMVGGKAERQRTPEKADGAEAQH
jgi:hypothetical protein